ncbi:MAG: RNA polymerase subunit sigma-24 [Planctomycetota bacterium]|nr:MAG: RNA polymerase subunit sigma-24 [Planctomycetota bacterium]
MRDRFTMPGEDDLTLLQRLHGGDLGALDALVTAYQDIVVRFARIVTLDDSAAHDAAQEAFVRLWRNPRALAGGSLRAWLCAVARNVALNDLRSARRRARRQESRPEGRATPPPQKASDREHLARVRAFIDTLPEQERAALLLYAVEGMDQSEVAQALGTTAAAVKQAVLSARRKLREKFAESS